MVNEGGMLTTAWGNAFGPDAESWIRFSKVGKQSFDINYSSSRGMKAVRRIPTVDRQNARTLVLGYNSQMPLTIENTTSLGTSTAVLEELRTSGQRPHGPDPRHLIAADAGPAYARGQVEDGNHRRRTGRWPVPVVKATGQFTGRSKTAQGELIFLDNRNNPLLLDYSISFKGEKAPRTERIVLVTPGAELQSEMEQALNTIREYTTRGIHFDFDKASIQPSSYGLLDEIAKTLKSNPLWTLQITGHTDSIGDKSYNQKLSQKRADSVKAALLKRGVSGQRLTTAGAGASDPVGSNKTLSGRALNRRVVLTRTDR